jgi:hypothetical protein
MCLVGGKVYSNGILRKEHVDSVDQECSVGRG